MNKETQLVLAKAIQTGIDRYNASIGSNAGKEAAGASKLAKTFTGEAPAAGTDMGGGDGMAAVPVGKGVLPETGDSAGLGGGDNADAGFSKDEIDGDGPGLSCPGCGGPNIGQLGVLGKMAHFLCRDCGAMATHPIEENTEAKEDAGPNVSKAEWKPRLPGEERWMSVSTVQPGQRATPFSFVSYGRPDKDIQAAASKNKVAESRAQEVEKAELAKVTPPGKEKLVHKLKDEYGHDKKGKEKAYATAWAVHNKKVNKAEWIAQASSKMKKEELKSKEVPMTATVVAEKVKGAKDGTENTPAPIKTDDSGDITKGKKLDKGAMVEHIKAKAKAAGVDLAKVMGVKPPKTLQAVKPAPSPSFVKDEGGFAREKAVKEGKVAGTPVTPANISAGVIPRVKGGVQGQIAAQKKPLIPMVNSAGPVAKGEPSMAKPVTKSPASGPAAKAPAAKAAAAPKPKAPRL
jgi:hypothetical protein